MAVTIQHGHSQESSGSLTAKGMELKRLLDRAGTGDATARDELIALTEQRLMRLTRQMLRSYPRLRRWEETDDVFQTAIVRFHKAVRDVNPESIEHFFGLAATQVRRTLIDLTRHYFGPQGHGANHASDVSGGINEKSAVDQQSPDDSAVSFEFWNRFHQTAGDLPDEERTVFELIWYGGLEQKDVAEAMGISISTVQRRWYRFRHLLHQQLADTDSRH